MTLATTGVFANGEFTADYNELVTPPGPLKINDYIEAAFGEYHDQFIEDGGSCPLTFSLEDDMSEILTSITGGYLNFEPDVSVTPGEYHTYLKIENDNPIATGKQNFPLNFIIKNSCMPNGFLGLLIA